jgi:glycerol kinase
MANATAVRLELRFAGSARADAAAQARELRARSGEPWQQAVAVVESIVFLLQANIDEMATTLPPAKRIRVSGGVSRLDGLCRRLASVSGLPVHRRDDPEATARGIAYLAAGRPAEWSRAEDERVFAPQDDAPLRARYRRWRARMAEATGH